MQRPDGRKPEADEGAGQGLGGVIGNPVARSEREKQKRHLDVRAVLGSKRCGCDIQRARGNAATRMTGGGALEGVIVLGDGVERTAKDEG